MNKLTPIFAAAFMALTSGFQAEAQQQFERHQPEPMATLDLYACGPTDEMVANLQAKFKEVLVFAGVSGPAHLDRVFYNPESLTYTFLRSNIRQDKSCVILDGQNGMIIEPVAITPKPRGPLL